MIDWVSGIHWTDDGAAVYIDNLFEPICHNFYLSHFTFEGSSVKGNLVTVNKSGVFLDLP